MKNNIKESPTKFTREYKHYDGRRSVWTYDLEKTTAGPISVEQFYPNNWEFEEPKNKSYDKNKRTSNKNVV
jgi:hypothetical protein